MQKGNDGRLTLAPDYIEKSFRIVIDFELLCSVERKRFFRVKTNLTNQCSLIVRYVEKEYNNVDNICIASVGLKTLSYNVCKMLHLEYVSIQDFPDEEQYQLWLEVINPKLHIATNQRRYYSKNSKLFNEVLKGE